MRTDDKTYWNSRSDVSTIDVSVTISDRLWQTTLTPMSACVKILFLSESVLPKIHNSGLEFSNFARIWGLQARLRFWTPRVSFSLEICRFRPPPQLSYALMLPQITTVTASLSHCCFHWAEDHHLHTCRQTRRDSRRPDVWTGQPDRWMDRQTEIYIEICNRWNMHTEHITYIQTIHEFMFRQEVGLSFFLIDIRLIWHPLRTKSD